MTRIEDLLVDYEKAQADGHHPDCDGWRTAHRITVERTEHGTYVGVCADGCDMGPGSWTTHTSAEHHSTGHSQEVPCDKRCREWT